MKIYKYNQNGYINCDDSDIEYLYHWVQDDDVMNFVLKNGIIAVSDEDVYLSEKPLFSDRGHLFKVKIPKKERLYDWREMWYDDNGIAFDSDHQYDEKNPYFIYMGDIPKENVELVW